MELKQKKIVKGESASGGKTKLGSALVFSLIILSVMLVIAAGSFTVSVIDQQSGNDTNKSVSAFQAADSGVEVIRKIYENALTSNPDTTKLVDAGLCSGSNNYYEDTISGRKYTVTYFDSTGEDLICSSATVSEIDEIKSVGEYNGTSRAVEVAVAATSCPSGTFDLGISCVEENLRTYNADPLSSFGQYDKYRLGAAITCNSNNRRIATMEELALYCEEDSTVFSEEHFWISDASTSSFGCSIDLDSNSLVPYNKVLCAISKAELLAL